MADVTIEVGAKVDEALRALGDLRKSVSEIGEQSHTSEIAIGSFFGTFAEKAAEKALEILAEIPKLLFEAVDAASDAEKNFTQLNISLALSGNYSKETSEEFEKYALSLSKTSIYSQNQIVKNAALIETFGNLSENGLKKATQAALELASVMGGDLDRASQMLARASEGNFMMLHRYGIYFKESGDSAKDFQTLLDTIIGRFGGVAKAQTDTYSASVKMLHNNFELLLESVGQIIIKNPEFLQGINIVATAFGNLAKFILESKNSIESFVSTAISGFAKISGITDFRKGLEKVFEKPTTKDDLNNEFLANKKNPLSNSDPVNSYLDDLNLKAGGSGSMSKSQYDKYKKDQADLLDYKKINIEEDSKSRDSEGKAIDKAFKRIGRQEDRDKIGDQQDTARTIGLGASIFQGSGGVTSAATIGLGLIPSIGPIIGQALGPVLDALSKGPNAVKSMIKQFTDAIPTIIENIVESMPVVAETLAEEMPTVVTRLANDMPRVINTLIQNMPSVAIKLADSMPLVAISLSAQAPKIATSFITEFIKGIPKIIEGIASGVGDAIKTVVTGGGGHGGLSNIPIIGGILGGDFFAEGGSYAKQVPEGFPNDSFPAHVQSGELIVDRTTSDKLKAFLNNPGQAGGDLSTGILAQILHAVSAPMTVQSKVSVDRSVFASIMLECSRANLRTS